MARHIEHNFGLASIHGVIGGLIAGVVFAALEMIAAGVTTGNPLMPLHMIASIPLQTPPSDISVNAAVFTGGLFHLAFSMALGVIAALIATSAELFHGTETNTVVYGVIFGAAVWIVNFYGFALLLNVPWFPRDTDPLQQLTFHALFGLTLGLYFASTFKGHVHRLVHT